MVDANGRLFNGDELLYLMADDRLGRDEHVPGVVGTLMTNMAVEVALKARGVQFVRAKVGDRYVLEELEKHRWMLGGEGSGHLLALDKHTTGDGLISALQILQACVRSGQTLAQLLADLTLFPQVLINVTLQPGQDWKSSTALAQETERVLAELGDTGRVLIRASGTEPLLRVMVEARDPAQAQALRAAAGAGGDANDGAMAKSIAAPQGLTIERADYGNAMHAQALVDMLDAYARDPAGGGHALSEFARHQPGLEPGGAAAGLQRAGIRWRSGRGAGQLHRGVFHLCLPPAGQCA